MCSQHAVYLGVRDGCQVSRPQAADSLPGETRRTQTNQANSCPLTCVVAEPGAAAPRGLEALVSCLIIRQSFLFWLLVWNLQPYWTSFGFTHWLCSLWLWKLGTSYYLCLEHYFPAFCLVNSYATFRHQHRYCACRRFSQTQPPHWFRWACYVLPEPCALAEALPS